MAIRRKTVVKTIFGVLIVLDVVAVLNFDLDLIFTDQGTVFQLEGATNSR
jgi:hypothetical protein